MKKLLILILFATSCESYERGKKWDELTEQEEYQKSHPKEYNEYDKSILVSNHSKNLVFEFVNQKLSGLPITINPILPTKLTYDKYSIEGFVEAQNGTMSMVPYSGVLYFKGGDLEDINNWYLETLFIGGEKVK
jgi:hypothetical protein